MSNIDTPSGRIYYEKMGKGPSLVLLNGGPGLELSYMLAGLSPLSKWRTLYFFDQFGCGEDSNYPLRADFLKTVNHALDFIASLGLKQGTVGLLGHSFGAAIALKMIEGNFPARELIFINPVPPTAELYGRVKIDISPEDVERIGALVKLQTRESGVALMEIYSKYYCEHWPTRLKFKYRSFDVGLCERVVASMGKYDFRSSLTRVPKRSLLVKAENDFIRPELLSGYDEVFSNVVQMPGARHLSFLDRPEEFLSFTAAYFEERT